MALADVVHECQEPCAAQYGESSIKYLDIFVYYTYRYAGILSAYGMALADVVHECQEPFAAQYGESSIKYLDIFVYYTYRYAGILSAYGMALADVVHECQEPCAAQYGESSIKYLDERIKALSTDCEEELIKQGFKRLVEINLEF